MAVVHAAFLHINAYVYLMMGVWKIFFLNIEIVPSAQVQVVGKSTHEVGGDGARWEDEN